MKRFLRKVALPARDHLKAESSADFGQFIGIVGWSPEPRAELEAYFGKVEKGCRATLNTAYAAQARAVLAMCRAARDECFGDYVTPVRTALVAASLAQAYQELLTSVLLERPVRIGDAIIEESRDEESEKRRKKQEHEAERQFYRQRFEHYAGRLPDLSLRSLRRLAAIDAKDAGWPLRKDTTYAAWTLDLKPVQRVTAKKLVVGSSQPSA